MCSAGVVLVVRVWGRESDGSRVEARGRGRSASPELNRVEGVVGL